MAPWKPYVPTPLPRFDETRGSLPVPIYDEHPSWTETYGKAWELAFSNFHEPGPGSSLVSQFIDAAFNENIFLWDSCFMTMFCDVAYPLVPGISTLDNFYASQHPTGEIAREISRETGIDFEPWRNVEDRPLFSRWGFGRRRAKGPFPVDYGGREPPSPNPRVTLDALNHPLLAWSELEHFRWTGEKGRLALVWQPLLQYYHALQKYLRRNNGLFMTDWASMDNSPRNRFLEGGGCGVDISSEMVLFGRQLAQIARVLGNGADPAVFDAEASDLAAAINRKMWDPKARFYFDLTRDDRRIPVKTIAAYWTLIAGVAAGDQVEALVAELRNPRTFGRRNPVPTCAADAPGYRSYGGYWRGAVWAPTNTMVIRGLERAGQADLAREIALRHIDLVTEVYRTTGTIWENYAPDSPRPGRILRAVPVRRDFVGWSGIGPILYLLEHAIGLKPNAGENRLDWRLASDARCGCSRFRFGGHVVSLVAEPARPDAARRVEVTSDGAFTLAVAHRQREQTFAVGPGSSSFTV